MVKLLRFRTKSIYNFEQEGKSEEAQLLPMLSVDLDLLTSIHIKPKFSNQYTTQTHQQSSACAEEEKIFF